MSLSFDQYCTRFFDLFLAKAASVSYHALENMRRDDQIREALWEYYKTRGIVNYFSSQDTFPIDSDTFEKMNSTGDIEKVISSYCEDSGDLDWVSTILNRKSMRSTKCEKIANETFEWMFESLVEKGLATPMSINASRYMFWNMFLNEEIREAFCSLVCYRDPDECTFAANVEIILVIPMMWNVDEHDFSERICCSEERDN